MLTSGNSRTPDGLPPLQEVLARHDLQPRRALGQNFLFDFNITRKIARLGAPLTESTIIEVGPGPGGLTRALLIEGARQVIAIEKDPRCLAALEEIVRFYPDRLRIVTGDALSCRYETLGTAPRQLIANLPYNIATPLLIGWLTGAAIFDRIVTMVQKEVADRLIAKPRQGNYGRLSVLAQLAAKVHRAFDVHPRAFVPPPKVTSSVVVFAPIPRGPLDWEKLQRLTAHAFGKRRKMLRQSLRGVWPDERALNQALEQVGAVPTARAEELTPAQFAALSHLLPAGPVHIAGSTGSGGV
ncbi:MAG TPA: 16S rRNA (adenine(1518)-N(6)/adenine(1519)-N(6))-dimethyltransferase RsmA [Dongiaceae bacterium]|jgi:16S rRNA (adenine1518-N6/adenine1519-N6)-dimethyltransferase|nr:16S rRNA (adenine(1518)-N(6)/adenine(1519)-N(6))-dimethyltransferase RsmA [Dongiaceae bacterium]